MLECTEVHKRQAGLECIQVCRRQAGLFARTLCFGCGTYLSKGACMHSSMPPWPHAAPRQTSIHQAHLATNHCLFPTRCRLLLLALPSALACAVIDMCVDALPPARHVLETNVYGCLSGHVAPIHMFLDALPRGPTEARHPPLPHNSP